MRKHAIAVAAVSALALGGVAAPAPANAQGISTNFVSPDNGNPLYGTNVSPDRLPGPLGDLHSRGLLDEVMVGTGIALGLVVAAIYAGKSFHNLQIGDGGAAGLPALPKLPNF